MYPLHDLIGEVAAESFMIREPLEIQGRAYSVRALETALRECPKEKFQGTGPSCSEPGMMQTPQGQSAVK